MVKLALITVQSEYLLKISGQMERIFGGKIHIHPIQLSILAENPISPDEIVFSAIPKIKRQVIKVYPEVTRFIRATRAVNPVTLGDLAQVEAGKTVLVVSDILQASTRIVQELQEYDFGHNYIPFSPESPTKARFDYVVTTGDLPLVYDLGIVPKDYLNIINIGLRGISLDTVSEVNRHLDQPLDYITLCKRYLGSLVYVAQKWPVARRNKYLSSWVSGAKRVGAKLTFDDFVANSQVMQDIIQQAEKFAQSDSHIHISGEIGVGKEALAQAIHNASPRAAGPYLRSNSSGRNSVELEKELFGWEENHNIYPGLFELAAGGTLCIEDIGSLGPELQNRVVQFIDEARILRVGGRNYVPVDVRLITTSLNDITVMHEQNLIQKELYFRLAMWSCHFPSLAERPEDFDGLIRHYLEHTAKQPDLVMTPGTADILENQVWEGNVRELNNVLAHLACLAEKRITPDLLPYYIKRNPKPAARPEAERPPHWDSLVAQIESNDFLDEMQAILEVYLEGKRHKKSFGRQVMCEKLSIRGVSLSPQQLRLRQQRLNEMGLLWVRRGRAGTTISTKGEQFVQYLNQGSSKHKPSGR